MSILWYYRPKFLVVNSAILGQNPFCREKFQMLQIKPVASASPNGTVHIARRYRSVSYNQRVMQRVESIEENHRQQLIRKVTKRNESIENARHWIADGMPMNTTMVGSVKTIGLRKDAALRDGSESMRHGRGPGFKRQMRKDACIARIKKEIASANKWRLVEGWKYDLNKLCDSRHISSTEREISAAIDQRWRDLSGLI